jgi:hypothetical protein
LIAQKISINYDITNIIKEIITFRKIEKENNNQYVIVKNFNSVELNINNFTPKEFEKKLYNIGHDGNPIIEGEKSFSNSDFNCVLDQINSKKTYIFNDSTKKNYKLVMLKNILSDRKKNINYEYFHFSIPLFSCDQKTAYIELDYQSKGIYGEGMSYILKKTNNKWTIIRVLSRWIT